MMKALSQGMFALVGDQVMGKAQEQPLAAVGAGW